MYVHTYIQQERTALAFLEVCEALAYLDQTPICKSMHVYLYVCMYVYVRTYVYIAREERTALAYLEVCEALAYVDPTPICKSMHVCMCVYVRAYVYMVCEALAYLDPTPTLLLLLLPWTSRRPAPQSAALSRHLLLAL